MNAAKITNYHFKMCIAGKSLQYSYCDYWLYGGVQDLTAELLKNSEKYQERTLFNLTLTPETFKSLQFEKDHVAELNKEKAKGTVTEKPKKKRLSGAQCRKRNKQREEEQQEKVRHANKRRKNGRRERERRDTAQRENKRRRNDRQRDEERHRNDCRREEDRRRTDYHRGVRRY
jgi:hypothetical protein